MKYIDEYRNAGLIKKISAQIKAIAPKNKINIMEVCGTHTQSFCRFGLKKLLPPNLNFISGPGCPVCVSSQEFLDSAIRLAQNRDTIIATFGDLLRVPGTKSSLEKERARGANINIVYSPLDSLRIAKENPDKKVVFLAVGFETTAPTIALSILSCAKSKIKNLSFLPALKLIPAAMEYILQDKSINISGFLCPGHVSTIIGTRPYEFIVKGYSTPCCVAGFEPVDILEGIYFILRQIINKKPEVANQYSRVVRREGNAKAINVMKKVFQVYGADWRGFGSIRNSGLRIRDEFAIFDANRVFHIKTPGRKIAKSQGKCRCADILKGLIKPSECLLYAKLCTPDNPVGPCMVSTEGACNAYYKYRS